jgi:hypothetical protein
VAADDIENPCEHIKSASLGRCPLSVQGQLEAP